MPDRYERVAPAPGGTVRRRSCWWLRRGSWIHLDHVGDPDAPLRMMVVHGAGGNADAMWPHAARLSALGAYVTVPDLPGRGLSKVRDPGAVRYHVWRSTLVDLIRTEHDDRPLVLFGAGLGGLLCQDVAAATGLVSPPPSRRLDPHSSTVRARRAEPD